MDGHGYYTMPSGPHSYSREPSPRASGGITMVHTRSTSTSRHRRSTSSQERPVLTMQEGRHTRSYHSSNTGHLTPVAPPMGRSLSNREHRPSGVRVHSSSSQGVTITYPENGRPNHVRALSSGSGFSYDGKSGGRRRPSSYYAASSWADPRASFEAVEASYNHSPRHSYDGRTGGAPIFGGATGLPVAPAPPISAYRTDDDLARITAAKLELEDLRQQEQRRGRQREERGYLEKQAAVSAAIREESDRIKLENQILKAQVARRPSQSAATQAAQKSTSTPPPPLKSAMKQPTAPPANQPAPPPPKNLSEYQAKVPKNLISRAALVEAGYPYEEHKDYLLVKRYLSKEDIKALLDRTEEIRKQRAAHDKWKAQQEAAAKKAAEDAMRPQVYKHTTGNGKSVQIVTVPQGPSASHTVERDWHEERKLYEAEKRALEAKQAREQAEFAMRRREDEERFKALEAKELAEQQRKQPKPRRGWFS